MPQFSLSCLYFSVDLGSWFFGIVVSISKTPDDYQETDWRASNLYTERPFALMDGTKPVVKASIFRDCLPDAEPHKLP